MLEAMQYQDNAFVTLTYDNESVPLLENGSPTLVPRHLQLFLKRLRHHMPTKLRFFAVGEYGNETWRPHYHLGLFNFRNCFRGETRKSLSGRCLWTGCCSQCELVGSVWRSHETSGDIEIRALDSAKSGYLAGYVTKKMTKGSDARLLGRHPEFSRQSRRPGVGSTAIAALASTIESYVDPHDLKDVPIILHQGKNNALPLGRYLRNKLRLELGLGEGAPEDAIREAWNEQVLPMLQMAKTDKEAPSLREQFAKINAPYEAKLKAQMAMKPKGKI